MGDVLPPKRDVVDRLKRRVDLYRAHHNGCLPRYEQAVSNIREAERQDTLLLRQRFLESKAKKSKTKSDHHRTYKDSISDNSKAQMTKSVKRAAEEPAGGNQLPSTNNDESEKASKLIKTDPLSNKKHDGNLTQQTCLSTTKQNQSSLQTATLSTFSVQIVQSLTNQKSVINSTVQKNVALQNLPNSPPSQPNKVTNKTESICAQEEKSQLSRSVSGSVECKQEKDIDKSDLCQFKAVHTPISGNSCDPLSDTFPSICANDDSGEDMLPPDVLNDLIKDMTDNPDYPDLMTDFFEDSVGSLKDQENGTKDIIEIVKPSSFQSDNVPLVTAQTNKQQLNGLFKNFADGNETQLSTISTISSPSKTTSSMFTKPGQRLPPSYLNAGIECLRFDYKMTEPTGSLAARTLKQLAEQHQSLQQQQVFNTPLPNRASFSQDNHYQQSNPLPPPNFLKGTTQSEHNNEQTSSSTSHAYALDRLSEEFFGNLPSNCDQVSPNTRFDVSKPRIPESANQQLDLQKPPPYNMARPLNATRPLTHFSANPVGRSPNLMDNQHLPLSPVGSRHVQNNTEPRFHFSQSQQVHMGLMSNQQNLSEELKLQHQQFNPMQPHSNVFNCYSQQQQSNSNTPFQVSMSQSLSVSPSNLTFSSEFSPTLPKPPPEYKSHHHSLQAGSTPHVDQSNVLSQPSYNLANKNQKFSKFQRSPNVTITPDGSALPTTHNWKSNIPNLQQPQIHQNRFRSSLPNFNNYNAGLQTANVHLSPLFNQYRGPSAKLPTSGVQMSIPGNTMQILGNCMPGHRNQNPVPRNQIPNAGSQMSNRLVRPDLGSNNALLMQQHQRINTTQCQRSPTVNCLEQHSSMSMNNNSMSPCRSPISPIGSFVGQNDILKNDGGMPPLIPIRHYSGPKDMMTNDGNPSMGPFNGPKDVINRNAINLDLFDNVTDLFDLSDIV